MTNGVVSTPDSLHSPEDEDRGRSRQLVELQDVLQHIDLKPERRHSPNREEEDSTPAAPRSTPIFAVGRSSPALTPEARKIAHSRSSSDINLCSNMKSLDDSPVQTSDGSESDAEDDELRIKPPLLRKKSGELVKPALRPASRRRPSSMPGTPTYAKAVHFNEDIEQVRHFLQVDRPIAVSAGSSPVEMYESETEYPFTNDMQPRSRDTEWEIKLANFPNDDTFERKSMPVRLERLFLSQDNKTLVGEVAVQNLAFHKTVAARFTLDYWQTTSEVMAEFNNDVRRMYTDGCDRFNFNIKLSDQAHLETKTMLLCIRYNVNGQEFWDNNNARNYQVDFIKKIKPKSAKGGMHGTAGTLGAIPRSKGHQSPQRHARTTPASPDDFDDFSHRFDSSYDFLRKNSNRNKLSNKGRKGSIFPDQARGRPSPSGQGLSNRYDFAASLSAALGNAQVAMGDRSGLASVGAGKSANGGIKAGGKTAAFSSGKPDLQSAEYNELIQKYCFFGSEKTSGKNSPSVKTPPKPAPATDGTISDSASENGSAPNSGSNSPSPNSMSPLLDGANDQRSSRNVSPFLSRSASPGRVTGFTPRAASPGAFPSPYNHQSMHGGFDYHTPTAIRG